MEFELTPETEASHPNPYTTRMLLDILEATVMSQSIG